MENTERLSMRTHRPTEGNAPKNTSFAPVCGVLPSSTRIVSLHKHKGVSYEEQTARVLSSILDRKSTRLNSSHDQISYAVFCLKKKKKHTTRTTYKRSRL